MLMAAVKPEPSFQRQCPADFAAVFVRLGRLECEEHYRANRQTITRWLNECGAERLIAKRWNYVLNDRASKARKRRLKRELTRILARTYPVGGVSLTLARSAAQYLRSIRNGGWIVSPAGDDLWWVGSRRRTAREMVEFAVSKGFTADLSDAGQMRVSCGR